MRTRSLILAAIAGVAGLTACATAGGLVEGARGLTSVVVHNNQVGAGALAVFLVSDLGRRDMLGSIPPGETRTFIVARDVGLGQYHLVALDTGGGDVASRGFTLFNGCSIVEWDIAMRNIHVNRVQAGPM